MKTITILFSTLLLFVSCKQTNSDINRHSGNIGDLTSATEINNTTPDYSSNTVETVYYPDQEPTKTITIYNVNYSFVLFTVVDTYYKNKRNVVATDIFETPAELSSDEQYRILDENLNAFKKSSTSVMKEVIGRELKTYSSYADASKAREILLGMTSSNSNYSEKAPLNAADAAADAVTEDKK